MMTRTLVVWMGLGMFGCATSLSSLQTAKTLDPGEVRVSVGAGVYVPAGRIAETVGDGVTLAKRGVEAAVKQEPLTWSNEDEQKLLTAGIALAAFPPSAQFEVMARVGLVPNLEAGLKYSSNALRLDAKYRLASSSFADGEPDAPPRRVGQSSDLAFGVGVSRYFFSGPVFALLDYVKLSDFDRWDVDATLYLSQDFNRYIGLYGAPKYVFSRTSFDEHLVRISRVATEVIREDVSLPGVAYVHFVGGTFGLRASVWKISLFLEATVGHTFSQVTVLGETRDLGGLTLYPAAGLAITF
jgi:hypothetical protein